MDRPSACFNSVSKVRDCPADRSCCRFSWAATSTQWVSRPIHRRPRPDWPYVGYPPRGTTSSH